MRFTLRDLLAAAAMIGIAVGLTWTMLRGRIVMSSLTLPYDEGLLSAERITLDWLALPLASLFYAACALMAWWVLRDVWREHPATALALTGGDGTAAQLVESQSLQSRPTITRSSAIGFALALAMPVLAIPRFPLMPGQRGLTWPVLGFLLAAVYLAITQRRWGVLTALVSMAVVWVAFTQSLRSYFQLYMWGC